MSNVDIADLAAKFVRLRDKVKEIEKKHEEELKPFREARQQLEGIFATALDAANVQSMKTTGGTISATIRNSATVEDMDAFRSFVVNMGEWDLADLRANAPAVKSWSEENKQLPPGLKFTQMRAISVRRPSTTE
jgi:hypothetical protein